MVKKRFAAFALATGLMAALMTAEPASAAVRSWSPYQELHKTWQCTQPVSSWSASIRSCIIYGISGGQQVYQAALQVFNNSQTEAIRLRAAVINLYATPSTAVKVRDDGCLDSSLSPQHGAICWGTVATYSAVCSAKPNATGVTANGAITINTQPRSTVVTYPSHPVRC